jgi:hypothetical protein
MKKKGKKSIKLMQILIADLRLPENLSKFKQKSPSRENPNPRRRQIRTYPMVFVVDPVIDLRRSPRRITFLNPVVIAPLSSTSSPSTYPIVAPHRFDDPASSSFSAMHANCGVAV